MRQNKSDIKRALFSWGFIAAVIGTLIAIIISASGDILPLLQPNPEEEQILMFGFHLEILLYALQSDVMLLCVPILCALPYTAAFVDDYKSGFVKPYLSRVGKKRYINGKVTASALSGGLALWIGIMLAAVIFTLVFTPLEVVEEGIMQQSVFSEILGLSCIYFLCGSFWSLVGSLFASVTMSKYMAYASPFIIYYVLVILSERYIKDVYVLNPQKWLIVSEVWPGGGWGIAMLLLELIFIVAIGFGFSVWKKLQES